MASAADTARIDARLPAEVHALLKRAAELSGRTLTDFVVEAARKEAYRTIEETEIVRVALADQESIAAALFNPPEPSPTLVRAFERRKTLLGR